MIDFSSPFPLSQLHRILIVRFVCSIYFLVSTARKFYYYIMVYDKGEFENKFGW